MSRGTELGGHLRVHRDHHFLLGAHNGISFLDLVVHPLLEAIAQNYSTYIDYPLLRDLRKVDVVRNVIGDVGLVADPGRWGRGHVQWGKGVSDRFCVGHEAVCLASAFHRFR